MRAWLTDHLIIATARGVRVWNARRNWLTTCAELTGLGLIVTGLARISTTLGLISAGVALVVIGLVQA